MAEKSVGILGTTLVAAHRPVADCVRIAWFLQEVEEDDPHAVIDP
jgi:hypothetical protein